MKKKYKLFFGSMAISVVFTAAIGFFVIWQMYAGTGIPSRDFHVAGIDFFDDLPEPYPVEAFEEAVLYEYDIAEDLPGASEYDYQEDEPYPEYQEYEYIEEEEVIVPVEPRYLVALTFDDGPSTPTWYILDILEYHDARATFFIIGRRLNQWRQTTLRAFENGHEIANHTYNHQKLVYALSDEEVIHEIQAASAAIQSITGQRPARMFRPPAGYLDSRVARLAAGLGYALMLWDVDPLDWRVRCADAVYEYIMANVQDGSIIVLHDTHATTAEAMERVVPRLIQEGFELVTVSELFYRTRGRAPSAGRVYLRAN